MTTNEMYPLWYEDRRVNVKLSTCVRYAEIYTHFIQTAELSDKEIESLRNSDLQTFSNNLFTQGYSRHSVHDVVIVLKSIISFYYISNDLPLRVFKIRTPSKNLDEHKDFTTYNERELAVLTHYILNHLDRRCALGVLIPLYTGLRIGEVCGLKWEDIDLFKGCIKIRRTVQRLEVDGKSQIVIQTPKTWSSARTIPLPDDLRQILSERRKDSNIYVVSGREDPSEPRALRVTYERMCKKAGVPCFRFHDMRHGFATRMIRSNVDIPTVSALLGHTKVSTTLDIYAHTNEMQKAFAMNIYSGSMLSRN